MIDCEAYLNADWGTLIPKEADALGDVQHSRRLYGSPTLEEDVPACWVGSHIHVVCCWAHLVALQKLQRFIVRNQAELHTFDMKISCFLKKSDLVSAATLQCFRHSCLFMCCVCCRSSASVTVLLLSGHHNASCSGTLMIWILVTSERHAHTKWLLCATERVSTNMLEGQDAPHEAPYWQNVVWLEQAKDDAQLSEECMHTCT